MKVLKGFRCAARCIIYSLKNERHMRIHAVVSFYVFVFSWFFDFNIEKYALAFLTMALVMSLEMVNSSIEGVVDMCSKEYSSTARVIKDVAAGAVFVASCFAAVVGLMLFSDVQAYKSMWAFLCYNKLMMIAMLLTIPISVMYVQIGSLGIKNKIMLILKHLKN